MSAPAGAREPGVPSTAGLSLPLSTAEQARNRRTLACFALMLIGLYLTAGPILNLAAWHVDYTVNPAFEEALALRGGSLSLPSRERDTALYKGRIYSVHPPLFVLMSYAALALGAVQSVPPDQFYPPWYVVCVLLPLPIVGYWAFQQVLRRPEWSATLTAYWLLGTPLLPSLQECQTAAINPLNHVLANTGLMLLAGDVLGRRQGWAAALGIIIVAWSRPHLAIFGLAALWIYWRLGPAYRKKTMLVAASLFIALGTTAALNWMKFDRPWESGYRYIYDYRRDSMFGKRFYEHGWFSPHFLPENLWTMNAALPSFRLTREILTPQRSEWGTSIWATSPLLLLAFLEVKRWWQDAAARTMMIASLAVISVFLLYHTRGASMRGYHIYSLDFLAVWMVAIATRTWEGWRRPATLACLAYSALYFNLVCQSP